MKIALRSLPLALLFLAFAVFTPAGSASKLTVKAAQANCGSLINKPLVDERTNYSGSIADAAAVRCLINLERAKNHVRGLKGYKVLDSNLAWEITAPEFVCKHYPNCETFQLSSEVLCGGRDAFSAGFLSLYCPAKKPKNGYECWHLKSASPLTAVTQMIKTCPAIFREPTYSVAGVITWHSLLTNNGLRFRDFVFVFAA